MDKLWCNRGNSPMEREKNPERPYGLVPCIGESCERWNEYGWDCIRMHRQKVRR